MQDKKINVPEQKLNKQPVIIQKIGKPDASFIARWFGCKAGYNFLIQENRGCLIDV
jgi:hypothetical protein